MNNIPKRRGRPPLNSMTAVNEGAENVTEAVVEPVTRRRRASVGGHSLKLDAPAKPGFVRRWFNDDGNRIAEAENLAYDHVTDIGLKTSSPGSRVSRLVGTKANGEPLHAYLMETPVEEYDHGVADKEAAHRQIDDAIREGRDFTGKLETDGYQGAYGTIQSSR